MKIEQHHVNKLLTAHRNGFAVVGQVAASRVSLTIRCRGASIS